MENIIFESKKPAVNINIEQLRGTTTLSQVDGNLPDTRPVNHSDLFLRISDLLTEADQPHTIEPIMVASAKTSKIKLLDPDNIGVPESWVLRRMIGKISLDGADLEDKESKSAIAISYDVDGITLAFGQEVSICSNMSIFGNKVLTTYGKSQYATSFMNMMEVIEKWIGERKQIREHDIQIFKDLKDVKVERDLQMSQILGKMLKYACRQYKSKDSDFITIGDVSGIAQAYTEKYPVDDVSTMSGWELYNMGTNILTHSMSNIPQKLMRTHIFGEFITNELIKAN